MVFFAEKIIFVDIFFRFFIINSYDTSRCQYASREKFGRAAFLRIGFAYHRPVARWFFVFLDQREKTAAKTGDFLFCSFKTLNVCERR
ncbi:hypothetical protein COX69_00230 [Candidatus Falkowbacteria bacterium CG_4_10_14_0_2_um_filter_48_10]|uniref:Uncharacterized protein n=1 Tax=Candidatus Falkowbacteria bacterium CG23_combo_of_CG06-09_8_20_14_all_49_15 TaxID=1974572 RepID=A0A2G9ZN99_9BACT|nr:MAG: hypothetical protein COX22_01230 [Candidatus Falkowbacteria bacterium CG23_combo_of_CG06-09_8_20_14_all_49_15]PJA09351.1 MAG: hypothetical protein COX69_00230 [Candidatus Falkowbacteria bacterium CG_4_10_14_0_2_um_filter_48_10]